jgi:hypothetical protein
MLFLISWRSQKGGNVTRYEDPSQKMHESKLQELRRERKTETMRLGQLGENLKIKLQAAGSGSKDGRAA